MEKIYVIAKEPGKKARHIWISNSLENLQRFVGGWIETFYPKAGGVMIVNEEGAINGMMPNCRIDGVTLYGEIIYAGADAEGNFADCPLTWAQAKKVYPELFREE